MKVAFLVLNHRPPAQLVRLVTTLRAQLPESPIVVHHDIFHGELSAGLFEQIGNVHLVTSGIPITWGDYSLVDVTCWSLAWMREHLEFDWMVLLSAQDYPIKPLGGLAEDLAKGGADAVFGATPLNRLSLLRRLLIHRRYYYKYRPVKTSTARWLPPAMRGVPRRSLWTAIQLVNLVQPLFKLYVLLGEDPYRFGWRARKTPFDRSRPCWHSSSWFALSRRALDHMLDYMAGHPEFADYYRTTMNPDESMLATLLYNSPNMRVADRDITYTRWTNDMTPHPDIFTVADVPELTAVPQYFARKFDIAEDSLVLDELDSLISARV